MYHSNEEGKCRRGREDVESASLQVATGGTSSLCFLCKTKMLEKRPSAVIGHH